MSSRPVISEGFFAPKTVAVIGATKKFGFGFGVPKYLIDHGYKDHIYLINPRQTELFGLPVYPAITDVPGAVDLAIIVIPAPAIPDAIRGCLKKGVRSIIIESAGFSETGEAGKQLEQDVYDLVKNTDTRIIGPNCVGVMNPHNGFATTEISFDNLAPGNIAVVAQSGVFGNILIDWAPTQNLGLSKVITIGNRLDVNECDVLEYLAEDELTKVIVLYMEGVKDGRRFLETARRVAAQKPVLVLKSGRTEAGKAATASHTGSMAGDDTIYDGLFEQCGLIRAANFQELFDMAKVFSTQPLPAGPNVTVVTSSGSMGAMTTDACVSLGLNLPPYPADAVEKIKADAPGWMNIRNPLDVGPSGLFGAAVSAAIETDDMHSIILIPVIPDLVLKSMADEGLNMDMSAWFGDIKKMRQQATVNKPMIIMTLGSADWMQRITDFFGRDIPVISTPDNIARAIYELYRFTRKRWNT
jgi:acyl-CoA synthetase (NDP forming)